MFLLSLDYCNVCTLSLSPWPLHESTCLISLSNARDTRNSKQASLVSICHLASHQTQAGWHERQHKQIACLEGMMSFLIEIVSSFLASPAFGTTNSIFKFHSSWTDEPLKVTVFVLDTKKKIYTCSQKLVYKIMIHACQSGRSGWKSTSRGYGPNHEHYRGSALSYISRSENVDLVSTWPRSQPQPPIMSATPWAHQDQSWLAYIVATTTKKTGTQEYLEHYLERQCASCKLQIYNFFFHSWALFCGFRGGGGGGPWDCTGSMNTFLHVPTMFRWPFFSSASHHNECSISFLLCACIQTRPSLMDSMGATWLVPLHSFPKQCQRLVFRSSSHPIASPPEHGHN